MKVQAAAVVVVGAIAIGGTTGALLIPRSHNGNAGAPPAPPSTTAVTTPSHTPTTTRSHTATSTPTSTHTATPVSVSGIACKQSDMWSASWLDSGYNSPATAGGDPGSIQLVQRMLNYVLPGSTCLRDDGVWDDATGAVIKKFQASAGLPQVNQAGPSTWTALQASVHVRAETDGMTLFGFGGKTPPAITSVASARTAFAELGVDEAFIAWIGADGARKAADAKKTCNGQGADTVSAYDPSGFAMGGFTDCGGAAVIWGKPTGTWKDLMAGQAMWNCSDLVKNKIPSRMYGALTECADNLTGRAYGHH
jgi:hypothetical protein